MMASVEAVNSALLLARERARKRDVLPPIQMPSRTKGLRERSHIMRKQRLRGQLPKLDKITAIKMHTTLKNSLSLDALQCGYHKTFTQMFNLMKYQQLQRLQAGPESMLWRKVMLDDEPEKLIVMKSMLTQGEKAMLHGDYIEVYRCYFELAKYFQVTSEGDKWLSDYFFDMAHESTKFIKSDNGRLAAEANCNVGLALKESSQYFDAAKYFEKFHALSLGKPHWCMDDGKTLHSEACNQLSLIYTMIAKKFEASGERENYRYYLQLAYDKANEGGDIRPKGLASFVLGTAYEKNRDSEEAIKYLSVYRDTCQMTGDLSGLSIAYQSMATSFHTLGQMQESIEHLRLAVAVAEKVNNETELSKACSSLGAMHNALGDYHKAVEYFTKAYNFSRALNHEETIIMARTCYGITTGHEMYEVYKTHIANEYNRPATQRLFDWKDSRDEALLLLEKIPSCFSGEAISSDQVRDQVQRFSVSTVHDMGIDNDDDDEPPKVLKAFARMLVAGQHFILGGEKKLLIRAGEDDLEFAANESASMEVQRDETNKTKESANNRKGK